MSMKTLRIATRGSSLARVQSEWVASSLRARAGVNVELRIVSTIGDRDQHSLLARMQNPGAFTREVEKALLDGEAEIAVHSLKDLPVESRDGLVLAAVPEREDARDTFVPAAPAQARTIDALPHGARVATSSPRRAAFLRARRPDIEIVPIRGNVDTRLRKIDDGLADGMLCAAAGLNRLGIDRERELLPFEQFPAAPAQGALGIQAANGEIAAIVRMLDHEPTRRAAEAERKILAAMGGGCHLALGAIALPLWRIIAAADIDGRFRRCDVSSPDLDDAVARAVDVLR